jgi:sortase A
VPASGATGGPGTAPRAAAPAAAPPKSLPADAIGSIVIPRLGLDVPLLEGIDMPTLDRGPGHWPGTAMPGEAGNVVVAGHRVSHTRPFRHIDQLRPGDGVTFNMRDGRSFTYRVSESFIVEPTQVEIINPTPTATATLFACHPPGSVRYRYVVRLELA